MKNKKIIIIGCGGSGKSTLARNLGENLNIPVIHLDQLYWRKGWTPISNEDFDSLLNKELLKDSWIIDGNFSRTLENRLKYCDTVIYLDFSCITCLLGVLKRVITNYGKTRPDMGDDCPEKFDMEFLKWIWDFNKVHRDNYHKLLSNMKNKDIFILHKRKEYKNLLNQLMIND